MTMTREDAISLTQGIFTAQRLTRCTSVSVGVVNENNVIKNKTLCISTWFLTELIARVFHEYN